MPIAIDIYLPALILAPSTHQKSRLTAVEKFRINNRLPKNYSLIYKVNTDGNSYKRRKKISFII
jgi:hypothetical protein